MDLALVATTKSSGLHLPNFLLQPLKQKYTLRGHRLDRVRMYSPYLGIGMSTLGPLEALVAVGCFLYVSKCDFFARNLCLMSAMKVTFAGKIYNVMQSYKIL